MIPVTVVLGLPGAGKSAWIERQLATQPEGARWVVLGQADAASGQSGTPLGPSVAASGRVDAPSAAPGRPADRPGLLRQPLGPGCACCALRPALGQALTRLLRDGPWDRLILEADGATHADRLVEGLRDGPLAAALRVEAIVLVIDGRHCKAWDSVLSTMASACLQRGAAEQAPDPDPADRRFGLIAAASQAVINRPAPDAAAFAVRLAAAGPFGRLVTVDDGSPVPSAWPPPSARPLARWPATPAFDRRALRAVLADWASRHPGLPARGAWPTARAWYGWSRSVDGRERWDVSAYCLEGRLDAPMREAVPHGAAESDGAVDVATAAAAYAALVAAIDRLRDAPVSGATGSGTDSAAP